MESVNSLRLLGKLPIGTACVIQHIYRKDRAHSLGFEIRMKSCCIMILFEFLIANNFSSMRHACIFYQTMEHCFSNYFRLYKWQVGLFIYCRFSSFYSRIFHSYGDVTIAGECCEYMYKPMMVIEQEGCRQGVSLVLWCVTGYVALGVETGHFSPFFFQFPYFSHFLNLGALFIFGSPFTPSKHVSTCLYN